MVAGIRRSAPVHTMSSLHYTYGACCGRSGLDARREGLDWCVRRSCLAHADAPAGVQKDDTFEGFIEDEYEGAGKSVLLKVRFCAENAVGCGMNDAVQAVGDMLLREIDCSRVVHVDVTDITSKVCLGIAESANSS